MSTHATHPPETDEEPEERHDPLCRSHFHDGPCWVEPYAVPEPDRSGWVIVWMLGAIVAAGVVVVAVAAFALGRITA
jgi:hypothetical protein